MILYRVVDRNPAHVRVSVFVGSPERFKNVGQLTFATDDWDDYVCASLRESGEVEGLNDRRWEVLP